MMADGAGLIVAAICGWLALTALMSQLQGWPVLMRRFPEIKETQVAYLSVQWLGIIRYQGPTLNASAGPSGLRLAQWRIIAPFDRPVTVPWSEIYPQRVGKRAWLSLGATPVTISIPAAEWEALASKVTNWPAYRS